MDTDINGSIEFYEAIDRVASEARTSLEMAPKIKALLGDPSKADQDLLRLARFELDFFNLNVLKNQLKPSFVSTNKDGELINDPDINKFQDDQWNYLENRAKTVKNVLIKVHFNHILWLSPKKNIEYAKSAINGYFDLISYYEELEKNKPGKANWRLLLASIENCLILSNSVKWKTSEIKKLIIDLFYSYDLSLQGAGGILKNLVLIMLSEKRVFNKDDFDGVVIRLDSLRDQVEETDPHFASDVVELIIKVEHRLSNEVKDWYDKLGQIWERITIERENGSFVTTDFCRTAIGHYMKSGNEEKVKELKKLYNKLRKEVSLGQIGREIDATELNKEIKKLTDSIMDMDPNDIISLLMRSSIFIPSKSKIIETVKKDSGNSFMFMVPSSVIDEKGNTSRHYHGDEEKDFEQLLFNYNIEIKLWFFPLIQSVLFKAVANNKINSEIILNYLMENSWYGQEITFSEVNDSELKGKWLAQIAPSIVEFFTMLDQYVFHDKSGWNLVTAFDSLTVKLEGIIRSLAEYSNIDTFIIKNDKSGRTISEEKDIMRLLTDQEIMKLLGEDDVFFLRFLFTERSGLNLRNKVAHGLMKYDDYSLGALIMIFISVLRLGRFKLKPRNES